MTVSAFGSVRAGAFFFALCAVAAGVARVSFTFQINRLLVSANKQPINIYDFNSVYINC